MDERKHERDSNEDKPNNLVQLLEQHGLDGTKWAQRIEDKLGLKLESALRFLKPDHVNELIHRPSSDTKPDTEPDTKPDKDWEKNALIELLASVKRKHDDAIRHEKLKAAAKQVKIAKESMEHAKSIRLSTLKKPNESGDTEEMDGPKPKVEMSDLSKQVDRMFTEISEERETTALVRQNIPYTDILAHASAGLALRGVYPIEDINGMSLYHDILIDTPNINVRGPQQNTTFTQHTFRSTKHESAFSEHVDKHGWNASVSASFGIGGLGVSSEVDTHSENTNSAEDGNETTTSYCSTVKYCIVPMATCYIESAEMKLTTQALEELKTVNTEDGGRQFFKRFGSHAHKGPIVLGGKYSWKASVSGFDKKDSHAARAVTSHAVNASVGVSYGSFSVGSSGGYNEEQSSEVRKTNSELASSVDLTIDKVGGASETDDLLEWKKSLVTYNSTWSVIQSGAQLVPVWDILKFNYKSKDLPNMDWLLLNLPVFYETFQTVEAKRREELYEKQKLEAERPTDRVYDVKMTSYASNPCTKVKEGGLSINERIILTTKYMDGGNGYGDRGFNIFEFDVKLGVAVKSYRFDTYIHTCQSIALAYYLDNLPIGTILLGVTADEPRTSLDPAKDALARIAVDISRICVFGTTAFICQIGYPAKTLVKYGTEKDPQLELQARIIYEPKTDNATFKLLN